ncbi:DUF6332 family protein [Streptomyces sp. NPDC059740]|uniref:DUF6332 family protein n=1 Tax=Streptomyces sp. NPDC059740 TaxID=3346926 RepID=UPI0036643197
MENQAHSGPRSQGERDALTVEIGYALASAAFLGLVVFGAIAGPVFVWDLPHPLDVALHALALTLAVSLAVLRAVHVLWRYSRGTR